MVETRESLLDRLKIGDAHEAWKEFYHLYWGAIIRYARKLGLNQHQGEEVLQETMVALMRILPEFRYDPNRGRFRNFLLTIVHRKSLGVLRRAQQQRDSQVAWDGDDGRTDALFADAEVAVETLVRWREVVFEQALERVRHDPGLGERTFDVFHAYVIEGRPAANVARDFNLNENAVYQIKNRLMRRLQREVKALLSAAGGG